MSFPVTVGEQPATVVGLDPLTGVELTFKGTVGPRERLDACGTPLDAWTWRGTRVIQDVNDSSLSLVWTNYDFDVAPQYGAAIVFEHQKVTAQIGGITVSEEFRATIGELHPSRPA
jgi:hypothetical protein